MPHLEARGKAVFVYIEMACMLCSIRGNVTHRSRYLNPAKDHPDLDQANYH